jgi:hypothetical protein
MLEIMLQKQTQSYDRWCMCVQYFLYGTANVFVLSAWRMIKKRVWYDEMEDEGAEQQSLTVSSTGSR